ncbi:sulfatase [Rubritalea tangerina]|uniref:Sulfatase n=1 Tax=Rubritalea tangerina TaxID=430798 RepID=A0ABW4ZF27_9BACT
MKHALLILAALLSPLIAAPKNVVFFFADDLGYHDLGCFGSEFYETPHLDALCADALKLTQAYAACPVCSPTRSAVMTGQYPARTKNTDYFGAFNPAPGKKVPTRWKKMPVLPAPYIETLEAKHTTIPEALKQHGFNTFFAGKWHLGSKGSWPTDHGFDINKGGWTRGGPYGGKKYFSPYGNPTLTDGPEGEHLPDRLATETNKFIESTGDTPFFAMLSFYSVHTPLIGRKDLVEKYKKKAAKLGYSDSQRWGFDTPRRVRLKQDHAIYAAMVEAMDQAVGKVVAKLKETGKYNDTVIIFTSDNGGLSTSEGWATSNMPLRGGKGWLYEGGIKEPTIIRIPGNTKPGSTSDTLFTSTDIFPTILDALNLPLQPKHHIDGVSLLKADPKRPLYWHYPHWGNQGGSPGAVVRLGDYKLIRYYSGKPSELFNLTKDPKEQNNLFTKESQVANKLGTMLDSWLADTKANMPTKNPDYPGHIDKW